MKKLVLFLIAMAFLCEVAFCIPEKHFTSLRPPLQMGGYMGAKLEDDVIRDIVRLMNLPEEQRIVLIVNTPFGILKVKANSIPIARLFSIAA